MHPGRHLAVLAAALLALVAGCAGQPAPPSAGVPVSFKSLDKDGDGRVSRQEFSDAWKDQMTAGAAFDKIDANKDLHIDQGDMRAHFQAMDRDGDGRLNRREFTGRFKDQNAAALHFDKMDSDGDGYLSEREYLDYWPGSPIWGWYWGDYIGPRGW